MTSKTVSQILLSVEQNEGVGAKVRRSIGRKELKNFDPFIMLDEFKVGRPGGFPDHPHRGFETVTYVLPWSKGAAEHEDFCGHRGTLGPGDLQWMTAGRGILHSEMPVNEEVCHGLQLWVNLKAKDKLCDPQYQELRKEQIPSVTKNGVSAIVIAGEALGTVSKVYTRTPVHYIHFILEPNASVSQPVLPGWTSFVYTLKGRVKFSEKTEDFIDAHHTVTFTVDGDNIYALAGKEGSEFVLVSGEPINEPLQQYGPFVMNTQAEIVQAVNDYQGCSNGFEKAVNWKSTIGEK